MKEADIRPRDLFDTYLRLLEEDVDAFFADHGGFETVPCPGCLAPDGCVAIEKSGFVYRECPACATLWTSPRPPAARLAEFYRSAKSVDYWRTAFYRETAEARREHIFRPRAALVSELLGRAGAGRFDALADVGAGYGLFLEEVARLDGVGDVVGIEPNPGLASVCRERGFRVVEKAVENIAPGELQANVVTAFEVLEHVHDPDRFLSSVARLLKPGGFLILTTLTSSGFDIQTLWERSKAVTPPQHLNFVSVEGMRKLIERAGLAIVELTTPGRLDVNIVENAYAADPAAPLPRFLRYLFEHRDEATREQLQAFLQGARLSSHVRVVARRA
jgi:SAM-dependent methyltransferase